MVYVTQCSIPQSTGNIGSRIIASHYVAILLSSYPEVRDVLLSQGVHTAFYALLEDVRHSSKWSSTEYLLSASRNALSSISEVSLMGSLKDFDALELVCLRDQVKYRPALEGKVEDMVALLL
jgi:hypothetical protein